ncbi:unnamed protein product, partial [Nesidiocoris tenuis]
YHQILGGHKFFGDSNEWRTDFAALCRVAETPALREVQHHGAMYAAGGHRSTRSDAAKPIKVRLGKTPSSQRPEKQRSTSGPMIGKPAAIRPGEGCTYERSASAVRWRSNVYLNSVVHLLKNVCHVQFTQIFITCEEHVITQLDESRQTVVHLIGGGHEGRTAITSDVDGSAIGVRSSVVGTSEVDTFRGLGDLGGRGEPEPPPPLPGDLICNSMSSRSSLNDLALLARRFPARPLPSLSTTGKTALQ